MLRSLHRRLSYFFYIFFTLGNNIPDDLREYCYDVYTIQVDANGGAHTNDSHGFSITFPPGVLLPHQTITLTVGVMMYGPFLFPDNLKPFSPIVWVCGDTNDTRLLKNARVVLPHCLDDDIGIEFFFMKTHVNHRCEVRNNKTRYIFESMGNAAILQGHCAEFFTSQFCCLCLATNVSLIEKEKVKYCITLWKSKANSVCVFAITYFLKTCIQVHEACNNYYGY